MTLPRLLVDLDGTVVDTMGHAVDLGYFDHPPCTWGFTGCCTARSQDDVFSNTELFRDAAPIEGAVQSVTALRDFFDVHFVSTPWPTNPASAAAKYEWVAEYFGDARLLTLTHDKTLIPAFALIDDKPDLAGPWLHIEYPQAWNSQSRPTWMTGLAIEVLQAWHEEQSAATLAAFMGRFR